MLKQLRQVAGVQQVKVLDFKKGLFALTPPKGGRISTAAISTAVARSGFTLTRTVTPSDNKGAAPQPKIAEITQLLATPRKAFRQADYKRSLELADALVARSRGNTTEQNEADAEIEQFRSLALFASGEFDQASQAARMALQRGKHWQWKTLGGHYQKTADYSAQLRTLENSIRQESTAKKRFLVAYHYWMLGQPKAARAQFERVAKTQPNDKLVAKILKELQKEKN